MRRRMFVSDAGHGGMDSPAEVFTAKIAKKGRKDR